MKDDGEGESGGKVSNEGDFKLMLQIETHPQIAGYRLHTLYDPPKLIKLCYFRC